MKYRRFSILLLIIGIIFICYVFLLQSDVPEEFAEESIQDAVTQSRRTAIVNAVERASPAVVNISAIRSVSNGSFGSFFDEYFQGFGFHIPHAPKRKLREVGSGVIISKEGYILTNHHVIEQAEEIRVAISDGREFGAHIIGYDFLSDLALLKVDTEEDLPLIQWSDSDKLFIGEWALAIGNPFGLSLGNAQPTVTIGIISATKRSLTVEPRYYEALIQTDASVNPGNSGGALVNVNGELIGINTVIRSTSGGSQGVGFAIPANKARQVIAKITEHGTVVPPYLGAEIQSVNEEMAEKLFGKEESQQSTFSRGVLVSEIERKGPFAESGIRRGDILWSISGQKVKDRNDFKAIVRMLPLNEPVRCEYIRRGQKRETELRFKQLECEYTPQRWGITFTQPDKEMARQYNRRGVVISDIDKDSGLSDSLKKGDVIFRINDIDIHTLEIFKLVDEQIHARTIIALYYERNGKEESITVTNRNYQRR